MSDLFQRATKATNVWQDARAAAGHLVDHFPLVSEVLLGSPAGDGSSGRLPGSIRVFTNGQELKACLSGREWLFDGYLVLPKEVDIITAMELELQAGRVGWSAASGQKNSSRQASY